MGPSLISAKATEELVLKPAARDYFKELGLRTFINAAGTYTSMTGSLMQKEVTEAITYGATEYVNLDELHDKVGERIAELLECEYATVSSGAFGAMTIGLAGVICGMDTKKVSQLPDTTGLKNEVIVQEAHDIAYTHALINTGAKIVSVKSAKDLEKAINKNTAMLWYLNANTDLGEISREDFVALGKKHGIPTFIDCAADVPPVENLFKFTKMGFDLVAFSGGKGIRGPQSAGLLLGKRKYIEAARLHTPPRGTTIARGMKVNKEEVLGMLVALELYLGRDHEKEWELWENQIKLISDSAKSVKGVETEIHVPPHANHVPSLKIKWDESIVKISKDDMRKALRDGHPSIETVGNKEEVGITTWMMDPGQERIVARRVKEILENA
ncbi:aminotransferase class V-fold PLP-dependent enzyme [Euzebyella marina]|uniref:Aminotransferase class V-fold PLP-dependent enzyme n=2 Tax=Euzebyella marina TaxID=1761453 RepID=A0A3G2LBE0_9FLAO|nr:aminotransferase class V-fold PLP-dependent enzyme [Euzebyella marina]MBG47689.1 selenocysteine synthase [Pseudozobellia sp.]